MRAARRERYERGVTMIDKSAGKTTSPRLANSGKPQLSNTLFVYGESCRAAEARLVLERTTLMAEEQKQLRESSHEARRLFRGMQERRKP